MVKLISHSADETEQIGEKIANKLHGTEVIALFGELGMGKTAFTRGLARALGVDDGVSSPTFALVNEYSGKYNIYHLICTGLIHGMICTQRDFLTTLTTAFS